KVLIQGGSDGRYVSSGHIVYLRAGALMAAPFDPTRLEITGTPVPVVEGVMQSTNNTGSAQASVSSLGWLAYIPGSREMNQRRLVWVDRKGNEEPLPVSPNAFGFPKISPDGQRIALDIDHGSSWDTWVYDIGRGTL